MFVVGEDQRRPMKGRTKTETAFKRLNNCVLLVQLGTFLTVATLSTIAAGKTMQSAFWTFNTELVLDTTLDSKTVNCTMNISTEYGGWDPYEQIISRQDFLWRLAYFSGSVRIALLVCGITLLIGAFNKILMELNVMEVKVKALIFRKEIITTVEIMLLCTSIYYCANVDGDASVLRDYFKKCEIKSQTSLPFQPPFVALYIGLGWTLFVHVLSMIALLYSTCSKPPPVETTRDHFLRDLPKQIKQHAQSVENTTFYPENANFQSAVDFAEMPIPQSIDELGPVMDTYQHAQLTPRSQAAQNQAQFPSSS